MPVGLLFHRMTHFEVQYTPAVNNPEQKVYAKCQQQSYSFHVPINLPNAHNLSLTQLIEAADNAKKFRLFTDHNNKTEG